MRLEVIEKDNYKLFINSDYIDDFDIYDNGALGKYIKKIILKIKKVYNVILEGFYEVHVYILKHIGIILEIRNIDSYLSKTIDLKIIIHNDEDIYLQIPEYELIRGYKNLKYLDNYFYLNVKDICLEKWSIIEHYNVVLGEDIKDIKHKWLTVDTD